MIQSPNRVLGVRVGTWELGLAVIDRDELTFYAVKNLTARKTLEALLEQARTIAARVIWHEQPEGLVFRKQFVGKPTRLALAIEQTIRLVAHKHRLAIAELSPKAVRAALTGEERATKHIIRESLIERFPELAYYRRRPTQPSALYWEKLFDAIALAVASQEESTALFFYSSLGTSR